MTLNGLSQEIRSASKGLDTMDSLGRKELFLYTDREWSEDFSYFNLSFHSGITKHY
jgi:hypothetical protein